MCTTVQQQLLYSHVQQYSNTAEKFKNKQTWGFELRYGRKKSGKKKQKKKNKQIQGDLN